MSQKFKPPVSKMRIKNFLSFGEEGIELELKNLNILIGPNGSGKSNFIDTLRFWQTLIGGKDASVDFFGSQGGVKEWLHKKGKNSIEAEIEIVTSETSDRASRIPIKHQLSFGFHDIYNQSGFEIKKEVIECIEGEKGGQDPYLYYSFKEGKSATINTRKLIDEESKESRDSRDGEKRTLSREYIDTGKSILLQKTDEELYPKLCSLSKLYSGIRVYQSWSFGRQSDTRKAQSVSDVARFLKEDYSNLVLIVQRILHSDLYSIYTKIKVKMREVLPRFKDFGVDKTNETEGRIFFIEDEDMSISSIRISDGTFRFFVLLVLLYFPSKQDELLCIEEPEMGLHPDAIPVVAEILKEVSATKQIIITTHSEVLVSCFSNSVDDVVVCENDCGSTSMKRLRQNELKEWLDEYSLGELWSQGKIGGGLY